MVHRREILVAASALLAAPFASLAQPAQKVRRIGFLSPDVFASRTGEDTRKSFSASLRRLGYEEGKNLVIEWRWGDAKLETLPALAEELVRLKVELIVARTNGPIAAAKRATRTIPIVMFNGNHPVEVGLVESLARPGGNITGTSFYSPELIGKQLQLLKEIAPSTARLAILTGDSPTAPQEVTGKVVGDALERAAASLEMKPQYFGASRPENVATALDQIAAAGSDALWYSGDPRFRARLDEIVAFALKQRLASVGAVRGFAESGGLFDYAPDALNVFDRTASYVDRILKGAQPANLPIEQPTKFNLVINLKTANALGLTIRQAVLVRADRIIQ